MEGTADWIFAAGVSERSPPSQLLSPASSDQLLGDALQHLTVEVAKYHLMSQLGLQLRQSHSPWLLAAPVHVSTQPCCVKSLWQTRSTEASHLQNQTQFSGHSSSPYGCVALGETNERHANRQMERVSIRCFKSVFSYASHLQCVAMQFLQTDEARHSMVCKNFDLTCILVKRDRPGQGDIFLRLHQKNKVAVLSRDASKINIHFVFCSSKLPSTILFTVHCWASLLRAPPYLKATSGWVICCLHTHTQLHAFISCTHNPHTQLNAK